MDPKAPASSVRNRAGRIGGCSPLLGFCCCLFTTCAPRSALETVKPISTATLPYRHQLFLHEESVDLRSVFESSAVKSEGGFNEALVSVNVDVPPGSGFAVEIQVGRAAESLWSPWLRILEWGDLLPSHPRLTDWEHGKVDVDVFRSKERFDLVRYRVIPADPTAGPTDLAPVVPLRLARAAICLTDTTSSAPATSHASTPPADTLGAERRLPVPARSQKSEDPAIAGRICSPTSVAMVLAYRGVERPTAEVAARIFDPRHDIYGNWPRAIQAAYSYGVPGYLTRFADWGAVRRSIAAGQPLVISIRFREGELPGAPIPSTSGHLLVLTGFNPSGDVLVNDPAAPTAAEVPRAYRRSDLEKAWLQKGGVAYVLLPR